MQKVIENASLSERKKFETTEEQGRNLEGTNHAPQHQAIVLYSYSDFRGGPTFSVDGTTQHYTVLAQDLYTLGDGVQTARGYVMKSVSPYGTEERRDGVNQTYGAACKTSSRYTTGMTTATHADLVHAS